MADKFPDPPSRYLLEKFSNEDLDVWKRKSEALDAYTVKLFYHLEGLRSYFHSDLCRSLQSTNLLNFKDDDWCRMVSFQFSDSPLSPKGSLVSGGRFNIGADLDVRRFPPFPVLYLAEDEETAYREKFGVPKIANGLEAHELALRKPESYAYVNVRVNLDNVFDLTKAVNLNEFALILKKFHMTEELKELANELGHKKPWLVKKASEVKRTLLDPHWKRYPVQFDLPANSQIFGRLLRDAGFTGVLYPSVKQPSKKCIAVFVENLNDPDFGAYLTDEVHSGVKYKTINGDNWEELCR